MDCPEFPDHQKMKKLGLNIDSAYMVFRVKRSIWDSLRILYVDEQMDTSNHWKRILVEAVDESLLNGNSNATLEYYVTRYLSKADASKLMRSRKVIGNCSQDQSPRYHAMNICQLAVEFRTLNVELRDLIA